MINLRSQLNYYSRNECLDSNKHTVHSTAKFCARDQPEINEAYIRKPEVQAALGSYFDVAVFGFVIAKDTFGARVLLSSSQLPLYGQNDNDGPEKKQYASGVQQGQNGSGSRRQLKAAANGIKKSARQRRREAKEELERQTEQETDRMERGEESRSSRVREEDNSECGEGGTRFYPIPGEI